MASVHKTFGETETGTEVAQMLAYLSAKHEALSKEDKFDESLAKFAAHIQDKTACVVETKFITEVKIAKSFLEGRVLKKGIEDT